MLDFIVIRVFSFNGIRQQPGDALSVRESVVQGELSLGIHEGSKRFNSKLLNHSEAGDDATQAFIDKYLGKNKEEASEFALIEDARKELDALEKDYDKDWGYPELKKFLDLTNKDIETKKRVEVKKELDALEVDYDKRLGLAKLEELLFKAKTN